MGELKTEKVLNQRVAVAIQKRNWSSKEKVIEIRKIKNCRKSEDLIGEFIRGKVWTVMVEWTCDNWRNYSLLNDLVAKGIKVRDRSSERE